MDGLNDNSQQQWSNPIVEKSADAVSERLLAAGSNPRATTSLYGTNCDVQPGDHELPVLKSGEFSTGCRYERIADDAPGAESFKDARISSAHIYQKAGEWLSRFPAGSGFAIAVRGEQCLIMTDNHVVDGMGDELDVKIGDDRHRAARVEVAEQSNDLAIVSVDTGSETKAVCKPVKIAPAAFSAIGDQLSNVGYPAHSESLYLSNGQNLGTIRRSEYRDTDGDELGLLPGEDPGRPILYMNMHAEGGSSGSGVYNKRIEVGAVLDAGDTNKLNSAFATPISQEIIDSMLKKIP